MKLIAFLFSISLICYHLLFSLALLASPHHVDAVVHLLSFGGLLLSGFIFYLLQKFFAKQIKNRTVLLISLGVMLAMLSYETFDEIGNDNVLMLAIGIVFILINVMLIGYVLKGKNIASTDVVNNVQSETVVYTGSGDDFAALIDFIRHQTGEYKMPMTRKTLIENDLGITGNDAHDIIVEYGKRYGVDISNFLFTKYFYDEPSAFNIQTRAVSPFTVGDLEKGILSGRLDEEVLGG